MRIKNFLLDLGEVIANLYIYIGMPFLVDKLFQEYVWICLLKHFNN